MKVESMWHQWWCTSNQYEQIANTAGLESDPPVYNSKVVGYPDEVYVARRRWVFEKRLWGCLIMRRTYCKYGSINAKGQIKILNMKEISSLKRFIFNFY